MKNLLFLILTFFVISTASAKTVVIGTGSGSVSQTSMTGLVAGDVLAITPGTYANGTFSNLHDITIINNGGVVYFTGTVNFGSGAANGMNNVIFTGTGDPNNFYGFYFTASADCIRMPDHHYESDRFNHIYGKGFNGNFFNFGDSYPTYVGTTASLRLYKCTFSDCMIENASQFAQGSYGQANGLVNLCDSIDMHSIIVNQTKTNGVEVHGFFTHYNFYNWTITYNGFNPLGNDIGAFYIGGSGAIHHNYMKGGRGYLIRHYPPYALAGQPDGVRCYDNIAIGTNEYGLMDFNSNVSLYGGNSYITSVSYLDCEFNVAGNKSTIEGYVTPVCLVYRLDGGVHVTFKNNIGFNLTPNNPGAWQTYVDILSDDPAGFANIDTSNNRYYTPTTILKDLADTNQNLLLTANSTLKSAGLYNANILTDFLGKIRNNPPSIGAEDQGAPVKVVTTAFAAFTVANFIPANCTVGADIAQFNWTTASEVHADSFYVQQSTDTITWTNVVGVKTKSTADSIIASQAYGPYYYSESTNTIVTVANVGILLAILICLILLNKKNSSLFLGLCMILTLNLTSCQKPLPSETTSKPLMISSPGTYYYRVEALDKTKGKIYSSVVKTTI